MSSEDTLQEGWEETTLGAFTTWKKGKKPQKIVDAPGDGTLPYLVADYLRNGTATQFASQEKVVVAEEGQCLLIWDGYAGAPFTAPTKGVVASTMAVAQVSDASTDKFVYLLATHKQHEISTAARGSTILHVDRGHLESLTVPLPPLDEQQRIVDLVTTADNYITDLKAEHTAAIQARKSLVEELLQPQEGWEETTLGEVAPRRAEKNKEGLKRSGAVTVDGVIDRLDGYKSEVAGKNNSDYWKMHPGDFAYNKTPSNSAPAGAIRRSDLDGIVVVSPLYIVMEPASDVCPLFLDALLRSGTFQTLLASRAKIGARRNVNISIDDFCATPLVIPPLEEQKRIGALVSTAENYIAGLTAEIEAAEATRKSLVDDLLTGRKRV